MTRILLTNDDGIDSPALVPFARACAALGDVTVVVPDSERSWVGKAITRHGSITLRHTERGGVPMWTASGFPADAVQLGVYHLDFQPDVVISGINVGYNHGAGYLLSSGTVGAALEGWIADIPAVAVSTGTTEDWVEWRASVLDPANAGSWVRLSEVAVGLIDSIVRSGVFDSADVVSVNLPFDATSRTERRITSVARVGYTGLFRSEGEGAFVHGYSGEMNRGGWAADSDVQAAADSVISITPINAPAAAAVPEAVGQRILGS